MELPPSAHTLISVLVPTRGRPALARRFLDSLAQQASDRAGLEAILYVDDDDQASAGIGSDELRLVTIVGPNVTMGAANTACLMRASGSIVVLGNDDVVVRTAGWDAALRAVHARFQDGVYLAWPDDRFASHRMSTFPILSARTCQLLVEPYAAAYRSAFIDYELFDIFTRLARLGHDRLVYMRGVVFEHRHHRTGKRPPDATSRRRQRFEDDTTFLARGVVRQRQAERLAAAIEGRPLPHVLEAPAAVAPSGAFEALGRFAWTFLGDRGLPMSRRAYLFIWYCGRYMGARIGM